MTAPVSAWRSAKEALRRLLPNSRKPPQMVVWGFAGVTALGTLLLSLPISSANGQPTEVLTALFTATSAVCVTGHIVVDTGSHWSAFGEVVLLGLIQIGGFGIMTFASLIGMLVARTLGLRMQRTAQSETKSLEFGEVRRVVVRIILLALVIELVVTIALATRFIGLGYEWGRAIYLGVFHAISSFNNAGFALWSDNLMPFVTDAGVLVPIMTAVVLGGIGFPVLFQVGRWLRGRLGRWSLHVKITLLTYGSLLVAGSIAVTMLEWRNPATLGPLSVGDKLLAGLFHGITPRTAGFNALDVGEFNSATLLVNDILMFIGGGSAGTAGGIKVTTFALLAFVIIAEIRGEPTVHVMGRRLPSALQRQALTVALLGVGVVMAATAALLVLTPFTLDQVLFESVSAFGTVGLSTGITADLPPAGQLIIVLLMFIGRLGPITLASALALRERARRYELPEERPIVG